MRVADITARVAREARPADWIAFLLGLALGSTLLGAFRGFERLFDPSPAMQRMILGCILAALALGVYLPHRFALRYATAPRVGRRGQRPAADRPLDEMVLAGMALICGVVSLAAIAVWQFARGVHSFLLAEFVLGPAALMVLEWSLTALALAAVVMPLGATWSCAHHVRGRSAGWSMRPLVGGLAGVAACTLATALLPGRQPPAVLMLAGALLYFASAILTLRGCSAAGVKTGFAIRPPQPPRVTEHGARSLALATVGGLALSVLSATVWARTLDAFVSVENPGLLVLAAWCVGVAAGVALERLKRDPRTTGAGCQSWTLLGQTAACAVALVGFALLPRTSSALAATPLGGTALAALLVGGPAILAGRNLARGIWALLSRCADFRDRGSSILTWLFTASAIAVSFAAGPLIRIMGTYAAQWTLVLSMGALCALAMVQRNALAADPHTLKRLGVLAAVGLLMVGIHHPGATWLASRPWKRVVIEEGDWITRSTYAVRGEILRLIEPARREEITRRADLHARISTLAAPLDWERLPPTARVAVLGDSAAVAGAVSSGERAWDWLSFDPTTPALAMSWPGAQRRRETGHEPALRFLRRTHRRYDLIILDTAGLPAVLRDERAWSELFRRAEARLTVDGILIVLTQAEESLGTLGRGAGSHVPPETSGYSLVTLASEPYLLAAFARSGDALRRWRDWLPSRMVPTGGSLADLLEPGAIESSPVTAVAASR